MELFLLVMIAIGVIAIYDARKMVTKYFSNQDQNKMTLILKLVGFLVCVICGTIMCLIKNKVI